MPAATSPSTSSTSGPACDIARIFPDQAAWDEADCLSLSTNHLVEFSDGSIEVLPTPKEYAAAGIPEYWVIVPNLGGKQYITHAEVVTGRDQCGVVSPRRIRREPPPMRPKIANETTPAPPSRPPRAKKLSFIARAVG